MKPLWKSKTVWGMVLLGIGGAVRAMPPTVLPDETKTIVVGILDFIGTTAFGIGVRSAIAANGKGV